MKDENTMIAELTVIKIVPGLRAAGMSLRKIALELDKRGINYFERPYGSTANEREAIAIINELLARGVSTEEILNHLIKETNDD
jgi:hypothetical protein